MNIVQIMRAAGVAESVKEGVERWMSGDAGDAGAASREYIVDVRGYVVELWNDIRRHGGGPNFTDDWWTCKIR